MARDKELARKTLYSNTSTYERISVRYCLHEAEVLEKEDKTKRAAEFRQLAADFQKKVEFNLQKAKEDREKAKTLEKYDNPEYLLVALNDDDIQLRLRVVEKFARKNNTDGLRKALTNDNVKVRRKAARIFAERWNIPSVLLASQDDDQKVRQIAENVLNSNFFRAVGLKELVACLNDKDIKVRNLAIELLEKFTHQRLDYVPDAPLEGRRNAIRKWRQWGKENLKPGLMGIYYRGKNFNKEIVARVDNQINFHWEGQPHPKLPKDNFSLRWVGKIYIPADGKYKIATKSDGGVNLWIGKHHLISDWEEHKRTEHERELHLKKGMRNIRLEYYDRTGDALIQLYWSSDEIPRQIIPEENLFHLSFCGHSCAPSGIATKEAAKFLLLNDVLLTIPLCQTGGSKMRTVIRISFKIFITLGFLIATVFVFPSQTLAEPWESGGEQIPGDRNGDGRVTIDEVMAAIGDFSDGQFSIDELMLVINSFLGVDYVTTFNVTQIFPTSGASDIPNFLPIIVEFNRPVDRNTIDSGSFTLNDGETNIEGNFNFNETNTEVCFTPSENLEDSRIYVVTLTRDIKDVEGNSFATDFTSTFTTSENSPPRVIGFEPSEPVSISEAQITVTFSEPINPASVNAETFIVKDSDNNRIEGVLSFDEENRIIRFKPSEHLINGQAYFVTLTTEIKDRGGRSLYSHRNFTFVTSPPLVAAPPAEFTILEPDEGYEFKWMIDGTAGTILDPELEFPLRSEDGKLIKYPIEVTFSIEEGDAFFDNGSRALVDDFKETAKARLCQGFKEEMVKVHAFISNGLANYPKPGEYLINSMMPRLEISGDNQEALWNSAFAEPLVVTVRERTGKPMPGVKVKFEVIKEGWMGDDSHEKYVTLLHKSDVTDINGQVQAVLVVENVKIPGEPFRKEVRVKASLPDFKDWDGNNPSVTFTNLYIIAGGPDTQRPGPTSPPIFPAGLTIKSGNSQVGVQNKRLALPLEVFVLDRDKNLTGGTVVFERVSGDGTFVLNGRERIEKGTQGDGVASALYTLGPGSEPHIVKAWVKEVGGSDLVYKYPHYFALHSLQVQLLEAPWRFYQNQTADLKLGYIVYGEEERTNIWEIRTECVFRDHEGDSKGVSPLNQTITGITDLNKRHEIRVWNYDLKEIRSNHTGNTLYSDLTSEIWVGELFWGLHVIGHYGGKEFHVTTRDLWGKENDVFPLDSSPAYPLIIWSDGVNVIEIDQEEASFNIKEWKDPLGIFGFPGRLPTRVHSDPPQAGYITNDCDINLESGRIYLEVESNSDFPPFSIRESIEQTTSSLIDARLQVGFVVVPNVVRNDDGSKDVGDELDGTGRVTFTPELHPKSVTTTPSFGAKWFKRAVAIIPMVSLTKVTKVLIQEGLDTLFEAGVGTLIEESRTASLLIHTGYLRNRSLGQKNKRQRLVYAECNREGQRFNPCDTPYYNEHAIGFEVYNEYVFFISVTATSSASGGASAHSMTDLKGLNSVWVRWRLRPHPGGSQGLE